MRWQYYVTIFDNEVVIYMKNVKKTNYISANNTELSLYYVYKLEAAVLL